MNCRVSQALRYKSKIIQIGQELMEIFRVFTAISPILQILGILTDQRFKKERSVHEDYMGWILEGIEALNSVITDSDLHKDSLRYSGFSLQFHCFC